MRAKQRPLKIKMAFEWKFSGEVAEVQNARECLHLHGSMNENSRISKMWFVHYEQ